MDFRSLAYIRSDYYSVLADYGYDHKTAYEQSIKTDDMICDELDGIIVSKSEIHDKGVFATKHFGFGDFISIAMAAGKRTLAGRYINHHPYPNAALSMVDNGDIILISVSEIHEDEEISINYRQVFSLMKEKKYEIVKVVDGIQAFRGIKRETASKELSIAYDLLVNPDHIENLSLDQRIVAFEENLKQLDQTEIPVQHDFIDGLYRRQITFKPMTLATGHIHPQDHMDSMLSGEMLIATEDGFKHLKAPLNLISRAGRKKAVLVLTDTIWASYHPTNKTTVEEVEKEIFTDSFIEIEIGG